MGPVGAKIGAIPGGGGGGKGRRPYSGVIAQSFRGVKKAPHPPPARVNVQPAQIFTFFLGALTEIWGERRKRFVTQE